MTKKKQFNLDVYVVKNKIPINMYDPVEAFTPNQFRKGDTIIYFEVVSGSLLINKHVKCMVINIKTEKGQKALMLKGIYSDSVWKLFVPKPNLLFYRMIRPEKQFCILLDLHKENNAKTVELKKLDARVKKLEIKLKKLEIPTTKRKRK